MVPSSVVTDINNLLQVLKTRSFLDKRKQANSFLKNCVTVNTNEEEKWRNLF
jgi:hypothetical protein